MRSLAAIGLLIAAVVVGVLLFRQGHAPESRASSAGRANREPDHVASDTAASTVTGGSSAQPGKRAPPGKHIDPEKMRQLASVLAGAQRAEATAPPPGGAGAAGGANDSDETESHKRAREHFMVGQDLFVQKDFEGAAAEFIEAYGELPAPTFLYNTAASFRHAGLCPDAIELFQRYLVEAPQARDHDKVEALVAQLSEACDTGEIDAGP